jgi:hypothetical protein
MSNIERYKSPAALGPAVSQFDSDLRIAEALCMSELLPDAYRGSIPNTLIAIDVARRMELSILQVCQNLHIIFGKPSWSASFLIGLVNASGKFTRLKPHYLGEGINRGCRMIATDLADGMACTGTVFTYAMAEAEGYVSRKGSKWKTFGEQMLLYRAASLWIKAFAPETSLGMPSSDEADDIGSFAVSAAPASARRGTRGSAGLSAAAERLNQQLEAPKAEPSLGDRLAAAAAQRAEQVTLRAAQAQVTAGSGSISRAMQDAGAQSAQTQVTAAYGSANPVGQQTFVSGGPVYEREPGADDEGLNSPDD